MDIYKYINKYIVYPLYYYKNGDNRLDTLKTLENNQYISKNELEILQLKKLKDLVAHSYESTEYYKDAMDAAGIVPNDIQSLSDIERLPVLDKRNIQQSGDKILSSSFNKTLLIKDASGGSTGEPTIFYKSLENHQSRAADQIRHDRWSGWNLGDRFALIWGAQRDLKAGKSFKEFILSRFIARIWELDAFEMSNEKMNAYVNTLERIQPKMILGYASALATFSEYLLKNHPEHNIRPKGIISSAETLTDKHRSIIEKAFHCKVLNRYGSREVGLIASECKHQKGLHINADNIYVEIVKNGKSVSNGDSGDILVTDLTNHAMPLIRYKLGDVGRLSNNDCTCGRNLPLMKSVEGRTGDFFVSSNGSLVHGEYFTHLFYGEEDVIKFQMIQETISEIILKIVSVNNDINADYLHAFISKTKTMLGNNCEVNIEFVTKIPLPASGKTIFTISKVAR